MKYRRALYDLTIEHLDTEQGYEDLEKIINSLYNFLSDLQESGDFDFDIEFDPETTEWLNNENS